MNKKRIAIFGVSGSIGSQSVELINDRSDFEIVAISAYKNHEYVEELMKKHKSIKSIYLKNNKLEFNDIKMYSDNQILELFNEDFEYVINAVSGFAGLKITLESIRRGKILLLANKESFVCGGVLIENLLSKNKNARIYPIDSEHAALYQLVKETNSTNKDIDKLIITASGGPFLNKSLNKTKSVLKKDVLKHPNWNMGNTITVNSATMINKALEIIEAKEIFKTNNIDVLVQEQSLIHSIVKYKDNSYKMMMSSPDMKSTISYFLNDCRFRKFENCKDVDFTKQISITFKTIDEDRFKPIKYAKECLKSYNSKAIALNSANETCVELFLNDEIKFHQIIEIVGLIFEQSPNKMLNTYEEIEKFHFEIKEKTLELISKY